MNKIINLRFLFILLILISTAQAKAGGGGNNADGPALPKDKKVNHEFVLPEYLNKTKLFYFLGSELTH